MPIQYPAGLPGPLLDGYALDTVSPLQRTQMDSGRARQRRRFTSVPVIAQVGWTLTRPQAQVFEGWFKWILKDGAEWFEVELNTPMGYKPYICRFTEIYNGPIPFAVFEYSYTAQLEIKERPTLSEDFILFGQDYVLNSDLFDIAMNQEWPEA